MTDTRGHQLTERETEILTLASHGNGNLTIATRLAISEDTVKSHLRHAYRKLGAADRAEAVAIALTRGLVPMPAGATPRIQRTDCGPTVAQCIARAAQHTGEDVTL